MEQLPARYKYSLFAATVLMLGVSFYSVMEATDLYEQQRASEDCEERKFYEQNCHVSTPEERFVIRTNLHNALVLSYTSVIGAVATTALIAASDSSQKDPNFTIST
jgi:hypothetical protein